MRNCGQQLCQRIRAARRTSDGDDIDPSLYFAARPYMAGEDCGDGVGSPFAPTQRFDPGQQSVAYTLPRRVVAAQIGWPGNVVARAQRQRVDGCFGSTLRER